MSDIAIRQIESLDEATVNGLADVLVDCVAGGASVGFMDGFAHDAACAFWASQRGDISGGGRLVFVAEDDDGIAGTVQVIFAPMPNQPHRADVSKMLVHRRARRRGIARRLLAAAEAGAKAAGRTVLVLDTIADSDAWHLYQSVGYVRVGDVPDYALMPNGDLAPTTFFWKRLD